MAWQVWQNVQLLASISQFILYLVGFNNYKDRLEDLADEHVERSDTKTEQYKELRSHDQEYYDYYNTLPEYEVCQSSIKRSRGTALAEYGNAVRRAFGTVNGYTPLQRVSLANTLGNNIAAAPAMKRAQTLISERAREDDHILDRWQAIISAPTHPAATNDTSAIVAASFRSLGAFGQGVNSAGTAIGTQLFQRNTRLG